MPKTADATRIGRSRRKGSLARLTGTWIAIFTPLPIPNIRAALRHSRRALRNGTEAVPPPRPILRSTAGQGPRFLIRIHIARFAVVWPSARLQYRPRWDEGPLRFLPGGPHPSRHSAPALACFHPEPKPKELVPRS